MKKTLSILAAFLLLYAGYALPQICCGGGVYDIAVLSLNKKALFSAGYKWDNYSGVWNDKSDWLKTRQTNWQMTPSFSAAYRFNRQLQAGVQIPYVLNRNELPGLPQSGSSFGDIVISGRYEIFHEYTIYMENKNTKMDEKTPYFAVTFGMTLPTGKSDENSDNEIDVTGKGFYTSMLGVSFIKTVLKNKLQIGADLSWLHSFSKTYDKYYNLETTPYKRQLGERFNYALTFNYLLNFKSSLSLALGGFMQGNHKIEDVSVPGSNENSFGLTGSYTYYPVTYVRVSPLVKVSFPYNGLGTNAPGSFMLGINLVYYIENLDD
ncbi:MAG: transporter [Bacteroidetes bacterium]|nr:transporter [Bacteroidota bacterium]